MFKFLKKFFKEEKPEVIEIELDKLYSWFDTESKIVYEEFEGYISEIKANIEEEKNKARNNLERLKDAKLRNTNIPERAKHIMEGNRASYIKIVGSFLGNINISDNIDESLEFSNKFGKTLLNLEKSTSKSYHVLQEFFANEVTDVGVNIRHIGNKVNELGKSIQESDITKIEDIKKEINGLQHKIKHKAEIKEELREKEKELNAIISKSEELKKENDNLKNSDDYKNYENLIEKKTATEKELTFLENNFSQPFSVLEKSMKKYQRIALNGDKMITEYLNDPVKAIIHDDDKEIIDILSKLKSSLEQKKLSIDDKKTNKSINEINRLNNEYFDKFLSSHREMLDNLDLIKKDIDENKAKKKYNELQLDIDKKDDEIKRRRNEILNFKTDYEKLDIEKFKVELGLKINKILKKEVKVL